MQCYCGPHFCTVATNGKATRQCKHIYMFRTLFIICWIPKFVKRHYLDDDAAVCDVCVSVEESDAKCISLAWNSISVYLVIIIMCVLHSSVQRGCHFPFSIYELLNGWTCGAQRQNSVAWGKLNARAALDDVAVASSGKRWQSPSRNAHK